VLKLRILVVAMAFMLAALPAAYGQSITSSITGTVVDETGGVIAGATVELTYQLTQQVRTTTTGANGRFLFNNVLGGTYDINIEVPGFNAYAQRNISVASQQTVALGSIALSIGEVTTTIEVEAESLRVETQSSDRTQLVDSMEIESLPLAGRAFTDIVRAMPGVAVAETRSRAGRESPPAINGGNTGQFLVTLDGVASQDSGTTNSSYISPNIDAIGEVKVVTANFNAEYGSRAGGQMNVTIKSGSQDFHGTGYYYWRHEQFNANNWFNNADNVTRGRYRYANPGGTIGGPVLIPGTSFNESRTKMFFFYSQEQLISKDVQPNRGLNLPTAAERIGDFSNSLTEDDIPLSTIITDPTTGELFPGGVIPQSRTVPMGRAILNLFPDSQGLVDPTGQRMYNSQYQWETDRPRGDRILRVDFNFGASTTSYLRLLDNGYKWEGFRNGLGSAGDWDQFESWRKEPSQGISLTVIRMLSPTIINETTFGINYTHQEVGASDEQAFALQNEIQNFKDPVTGQAVDVPYIFEGANYMNLIPNLRFDTNNPQSAGEALYGQNALDFGFDSRWPFQGTDDVKSLIDNVSWIKGDHNMKFGFYYERMARNVSVYSQYNTAGTYYFGSDLGNPLDTGWGLSNALLGTVQAYGEDNKKQINHARYNQIEWFAQDTWQATSRLSFDLGMRFQIMQPTFSKGATLGFFEADAYDANQVGQLLYPACLDGSTTGCSAADRVAMNPVTGAVYAYPRQGFFDPASYSGLPFSGVVQYDSKYFNTPPVLLSPRFGLAFDVFGDGKTALRGGFGVFYSRAYTVDNIGATGAGIGPLASPPNFQAPVFYNTTFADLRTSQAFFGAQRVVAGDRDFKNPTVYNWSFGIQQQVPGGAILDVAYVGNKALYNFNATQWDSNAMPYLLMWSPEGMTWTPEGGPAGNGTRNPELLDPTNPNIFLQANLIRGLIGYSGWDQIQTWTNLAGNSNYHSLQASLKYRLGNRLNISGNYTWSRALEYNPTYDSQWIDRRIVYRQDTSGRRHAVNMNFQWTVPGIENGNAFLKGALNNWQLSGVTAIFAGTPVGISCTAQNQPVGWPAGTPTASLLRCDQVGPTLLPEGTLPPAGSGIDADVYIPINAAAFVLPQPGSLGLGNAPEQAFYGPGFFNIDLSLQKTFPVGEGKSLEFRADSFNFLNHFNPSNPATNIRRRYTTGAQTRTGIGEITDSQNDERRVALSARFRF